MKQISDRSVCISKWVDSLVIGLYWVELDGHTGRKLRDCTIENIPVIHLESIQAGINKFLNLKASVVLGEDTFYAMALVDVPMYDLFDMVVNSENPAQALMSRQVLTAKGA